MGPTTWNGVAMPTFMYGTAWKKDRTAGLVEQAVQAGFRAIDTANQLIHYYEVGVGEALQAVAARGVPRGSLFLQTKFTSAGGQDHRTPYDRGADLTTQVRQSFESSLSHLRTDVLDSYVLHGPHSRRGLLAEDWEIWRAMEALYESKKTRMIGISNVNPPQLSELCAKAKVKPMVVQNRCFAVTGWDREVRGICAENQIVYQGFSLLTANQDVLMDPLFRKIGVRIGGGIAQVVFRFSQQIGMLPLTGTTDAGHMREDLEAERFTLTADEVAAIESIAL